MSLTAHLRRLRTLLFDPDSFFEERHPRLSVGAAVGVVLVVALGVTLSAATVGWVLASSIDATTTETVMEPWSESTCESFESMAEETNVSTVPEPCTIDEPKTREVDVGSEVWSVFLGSLPFVFVATVVSWLFTAVVLHVGSLFVGGNGSFTATLSVAGWAMVPELLTAMVMPIGVSLAVDDGTLSSDPELLARQLEELTVGGGEWSVVLALVVVIWQAVIWTHGLRYARGLSMGQAKLVAGPVALLWFLFTVI